MKIESTKNIIKQIEGTNTFEVKTIGKRKDLEGLRKKLELHGFTFGDNGEFKSYSPKIDELMKLVNELLGNEKVDQNKLVESIRKDAEMSFALYEDTRKTISEFTYILDMNNIEIITELGDDLQVTVKALIDIKENDKDGEFIFWKSSNNNLK